MARKRKDGQAVGRTKVTVTLDAQVARRLGAFAQFHGRDKGAVVQDAVNVHMKGFTVSQRAVEGATTTDVTSRPDVIAEDRPLRIA